MKEKLSELYNVGQKAWQFFVHILGETMTSEIHSEIYWPLASCRSKVTNVTKKAIINQETNLILIGRKIQDFESEIRETMWWASHSLCNHYFFVFLASSRCVATEWKRNCCDAKYSHRNRHGNKPAITNGLSLSVWLCGSLEWNSISLLPPNTQLHAIGNFPR